MGTKHGTPDFGVTSGAVTTHQVKDLGELAPRLGSPDRFDRRGEIVQMESFEDGIDGWSATVATGGVADLSNLRARTGGFSARLTTTGSSGSRAALSRTFSFPVVSKMGLEVSFASNAFFDDLRVTLSYFDGFTLRRFGVQVDVPNLALQVLLPAGTYSDLITGIVAGADVRRWHTLKLIVDLDAGEWAEVLIDNLSAIPTTGPEETAPAGLVESVTAAIRADGDTSGSEGLSYWDDLILTQNEP